MDQFHNMPLMGCPDHSSTEERKHSPLHAEEIAQLTFPHHQRLPAERPQPAAYDRVALAVPPQFRQPVGSSRMGNSTTTWVGMEETAVDKDDLPATGKHQVGATRKVAAMKTIAKAEAMHQAPDRKFGLGVLSADQRHPLAALRFGEGVHGVILARLEHDANAPFASRRLTNLAFAIRIGFGELNGESGLCQQGQPTV